MAQPPSSTPSETDDITDWLTILVEHYENDEAAEWLITPHELLGDESPLDLVRDGRQEEVAELVALMDGGAMV